MDLKDLQEHKAKLIQQQTGVLAQVARLRTDLDMLTGALQLADMLIKQATPEEAPLS